MTLMYGSVWGEVKKTVSDVGWWIKKLAAREPHAIIRTLPPEALPQLVRWWVIPRNPLFNIYLHKLVRDDDGEALHDHPWWSFSILLKGCLGEVDLNADGQEQTTIHTPGKCRLRRADYLHRLFLPCQDLHAWTLFMTGPRIRVWGFMCPKGWRDFRTYTGGKDGGQRLGCGEGD